MDQMIKSKFARYQAAAHVVIVRLAQLQQN